MSENKKLLRELENLNHVDVPQRTREEISEKVEELLKNMTLNEKIGQLYQVEPMFFMDLTSKSKVELGPSQKIRNKNEVKFNVGSVLGVASSKGAYQIQKRFLENNRLGIPLMFMFDVIHGFRTTFPIPLGLSCSWNMDLIEKMARVSAKEASTAGVCITFSPMLDLVRDPRWGRVMESPGEDPYLGSEYAKAMVRGYQGDSLYN
ncbi:MAG: glycoside hydrolase family 3 N-terminal domain-containing protein, partial [Promethearchaeota archaeon]